MLLHFRNIDGKYIVKMARGIIKLVKIGAVYVYELV